MPKKVFSKSFTMIKWVFVPFLRLKVSPPVVIPKLYCDVHLLRSPWLGLIYAPDIVYTHSLSIWISETKHFGTCSRVWNKHSPTLINLLTFFQGRRPYSGVHRAYISSIGIRYKWSYAYSFWQIIQGLCLFKTLEYTVDVYRYKTM